MYEIGTGNRVASLPNVFGITASAFSETGSFLVLGSTKGHVGIWSLSSDYTDNIAGVLEQMRLSPKFWNDYPIFLSNEDYGQYEEDSEGERLDGRRCEQRAGLQPHNSEGKQHQQGICAQSGKQDHERARQDRHRQEEGAAGKLQVRLG
jgi:hypothetical protein